MAGTPDEIDCSEPNAPPFVDTEKRAVPITKDLSLTLYHVLAAIAGPDTRVTDPAPETYVQLLSALPLVVHPVEFAYSRYMPFNGDVWSKVATLVSPTLYFTSDKEAPVRKMNSVSQPAAAPIGGTGLTPLVPNRLTEAEPLAVVLVVKWYIPG